MLNRWFSLQRHGTTPAREGIAGLTTFAAMAYILAVNPAILGTTGMDAGALVTATALSAALMTVAMALATNYPIALAPGMGMNAFFAFSICGAAGVPWQAALGLVFYSGVFFFLITITGLRKRLITSIPREMKLAITAGIGCFIAFIGLQNGGVIVDSKETLVQLGDFSRPEPLLVLAGVLVTGILLTRRVPGAIMLVMTLLTVSGFFITGEGGKALTQTPAAWFQWPASLEPSFLKLDLGYFWSHFGSALHLVVLLLFLDLFDNMGTLIGVSQRAGLLDREGNLPRMGRALMADAGAAMTGAVLGTSTVTSYIESAAGVEAGGRTGLTTLVTAFCFLLALFFTPLILIIPGYATAPALVVVGALMMQGIADVRMDDFSIALPAFITILGMPLSYSISEGLALGLLAFVGLRIGTGRWREVGAVVYGLSILFLWHFIWGRT